ncbi:MAG: hypothetical protein ACYDB2_07825 [Acidimicrobiales bacterium]
MATLNVADATSPLSVQSQLSAAYTTSPVSTTTAAPGSAPGQRVGAGASSADEPDCELHRPLE